MNGLAAEGLEELLVGRLGLGRGHAVGRVQAGQRGDGIDAGVRTLDETVPAALLQIGELHVAPRLDVLGHVVAVLRRGELADFLAVAVHHAELPVVEADLVLLVHRAHVAGLVGVRVGRDHLHVVRIAQHDLLEDGECPLGELDAVLRELLELRAGPPP